MVEDVSLVNEINSVLNPTWVNCAATILLVAGARFIRLGVQGSYSHQDFYQQPDDYPFDPDPGTNDNDFKSKFQPEGNLPSFISFGRSKYPYDPYMGILLLTNCGE